MAEFYVGQPVMWHSRLRDISGETVVRSIKEGHNGWTGTFYLIDPPHGINRGVFGGWHGWCLEKYLSPIEHDDEFQRFLDSLNLGDKISYPKLPEPVTGE